VRQELRHSDFLAFLLNPQQNHGLGDTFLKMLLQQVLLASRGVQMPINLIDLDVWSLEDTTVLREWHSIDLLLLNETNKVAVIIENKIDSGEHDDQLDRYYLTVKEHYPDWKIIPLFLTPEGYPPSYDEYLPVGYTTVAELVANISNRRSFTLGTDIKTLLDHYASMLRRHIVSESEITALCRKIYKKHQRALDLIFESRPNYQDQVLNIIEGFVNEEDSLVADKRTSNMVAFAPKDWDAVVGKNPAPVPYNWSLENRRIMFWVMRSDNPPRIVLEIQPGSADVRECIHQTALANKTFFNLVSGKMYPNYCRIWSRPLLPKDWQEKLDGEAVQEKLRENWDRFVKIDLPEVKRIIQMGIKNGN